MKREVENGDFEETDFDVSVRLEEEKKEFLGEISRHIGLVMNRIIYSVN